MADRQSRLRIVVMGYVVRGPLGGMAWHHLQYARGLADLGHDVYFLEESDDYASCYDPVRDVTERDPSYGLRFAENAFERLGLGAKWAYYDAHKARWYGPLGDRPAHLASQADILFNISGVNPLSSWAENVPVRIFIDTDPIFTQVRHLTKVGALDRAHQHTHFFSFGENIACGDSSIPSDSLPWRATRQPVILSAWLTTEPPTSGRFTTVMQWDSYDAAEYQGHYYGMKSASFMPFIGLPQIVKADLELAIGSRTAPRELLRHNGWFLEDPLAVSRDLWTYQRYLRCSKAEFSVAKHGYVTTNSGWFSERSAGYLASGRPVVLQDTGFSAHIPCGRGLFAVRDVNEAATAIEAIMTDPRAHARAAREIAAAHFDARLCLPRLLSEVGL